MSTEGGRGEGMVSCGAAGTAQKGWQESNGSRLSGQWKASWGSLLLRTVVQNGIGCLELGSCA